MARTALQRAQEDSESSGYAMEVSMCIHGFWVYRVPLRHDKDNAQTDCILCDHDDEKTDEEAANPTKDSQGDEDVDKNPTVMAMLRGSLAMLGYDGLFSWDNECACKADDLAPCGQVQWDCSAGYVVAYELDPDGFRVVPTTDEHEES